MSDFIVFTHFKDCAIAPGIWEVGTSLIEANSPEDALDIAKEHHRKTGNDVSSMNFRVICPNERFTRIAPVAGKEK